MTLHLSVGTMQSSKRSPLVSIIISTYNRAGLLVDAVNSVLKQSYPQVEVIVVDDGSTDETPVAAAQFGSHIRYIRQENAGVSVARNRGIAESKGAFIGFLDDDDVFFEDKLSRQMELLLRNPAAPAAHCNFYHMSPDGALLLQNGILPARDTFRNLLLANFIWMSGPLIRREALLTNGLFAPELSLAADLDMWLRLSRLNDFVCVQTPLGAYRVQQGSMVTNADLAEHECMAVLNRAYDHLATTPADRQLRARSEAQWRLWFGANYLNAHKQQDFTRNYRRAAQCAPGMFQDQKFLTKRIAQDALNSRVPDPKSFCNALFDNLPEELDYVRDYHKVVNRQIDFALALYEILFRNIKCGRGLMQSVIDAHPDHHNYRKEIREMMFELVMCSWGVQAFLARLRDGLPNDETFLLGILADVERDVVVWQGFLAYLERKYPEARKLLLTGIVRQPAWLCNRGIAKSLIKSLIIP